MNTVRTMAIPGRNIGTHDASFYVRVVGNAQSAHIETAPMAFHLAPKERAAVEAAFTTEPVSGTVAIDQEGTVRIESSEIGPVSIRELELSFSRALRDARLVEPETKRYVIGYSYVTLWETEAKRLATIAKQKISISEATIVHSTREWAYWSDRRFTTAIGLPKWATEIKSLSADAESFITEVRGSDSGSPAVGWNSLLSVAEVQNEEVVEQGHKAGHYASQKIERLTVRLVDGKAAVWWRFTEGYFEGYAYELHPTRESLLQAIMPPPQVDHWIKPEGQLWEPCPRCGTEPVLMPLHLCKKCYPKAPA